MKILYITTIGMTMGFFKDLIKELLDEGSVVDIATNETESKVPECYREWGCKVFPLSCSRSPFDKGNFDAIKQIKEIVAEQQYDIVHCHTPIAAMCTRLACRKARKNGTRVFYTAHGFHFYKGAPKKNWLIYYPIEKICSYFTDVLITINQEDYALAQKKMKAEKVVYVPGVGIDLKKFDLIMCDKEAKREELGIPQEAIVLLSVGELNKNKNHQVIIRAIAKIGNPKIIYVIAGVGDEEESLKKLASELDLEDRVYLLGYRTDIGELCKSSDIFCFPSCREGLGLAALEAMGCGLPIITSNVHGINDYSQDGVTGYKCAPDDISAFATAIKKMMDSDRRIYGEINRRIVDRYDVNSINEQMKQIYK